MHQNRLIGPIITTLALASVPTVAQPLEPLPGIVEDAQRLDQPTAEARFGALTALLDDYGLTYEVQTFSNPRATEAGPAEGRNLIVDIGEGERDLVVGAHYDAAPLEDGSLSHGMVDNASSVAVLARLAATLSNESLDHRLRILFFDLEEMQLLGSAHYVSTPDAQRVAAMVNLDINGYGNTVIYGPASNDGNTEVYDALERVCAVGSHGCLRFEQFPTSDDRSFQVAGIPNISIGLLPSDEARQLHGLLNGPPPGGPTPPIFGIIHTPNDTANHLDASAMTFAYEMALELVKELDRSQ